ncbi:MAG TPA: TonB family protein, partial [Puia sp.]|nr:TonB family protein [Puia sp.]
GTITNGTLEKNINLSIAKKIQALSKDYNVNVIMTRERDELPGNVSDINWSLKYRAALARKENADLFISIHTGGGTDENAQSGFEIYVPENENKVYKGSVNLASCITGYIKPDYTIASDLKQRPQGILVLTHASVPAILIECGNPNNKSDIDFIQNDKNQEKIARDILEGIRKYSSQNLSIHMPRLNTVDTIPTVDTITNETMNKIDNSKISMVKVDKEAGLITINSKDGKTYVIKITPEMKRSWDSAHAAQMNHPDTSNPNNEVFKKVEVEAEYPGGQQGWYDYLQKNLKYPDAAVKKEIQGQVIIEFIVKKNGDVTNIRVIRGPEELRQSSVDVLKESGKWIPAKQNGLVVESYKWQPINYKLEK